MTFIKIAAAVILTALLCVSAYAHSGGTDRNGCHTNRKTGDHHCH
ncbi:YHYH domain-containing protein [Agrobacterium rosae]